MSDLIISNDQIITKIYFFRNQKVMIDKYLADIYQVTTKSFNQAVKRNSIRFPSDFMFQLDDNETNALRSQSVTSIESNSAKSGTRYNPYVFIKNGINAFKYFKLRHSY